MPDFMTRRSILHFAGASAAGLLLGRGLRAADGPKAAIDSTKVITNRPHLYQMSPTLARRRNGELLVVCSGGREAHVCPFGRVEFMRSRDNGETWTFPRVLIDGPIDDRDAGVLETAKGSILVTTFTSLGYEDRLRKALEMKPDDENAWSPKKIRRWQAVHHRVDAVQRALELGSWMIRSTNAGRSWSAPYRCPVNSPHGPIQLSDGRLLYAGKLFWYGRRANAKGASAFASQAMTGKRGAGWPRSQPAPATTSAFITSCMRSRPPTAASLLRFGTTTSRTGSKPCRANLAMGGTAGRYPIPSVSGAFLRTYYACGTIAF